ncbi:MAG: queuosine precursor transporter [Xanthomonadales bacterium]|nr:queuosine precursor transporter [Xanthomonadales bacterium]
MSNSPAGQASAQSPAHRYRYFDLVMVAFVTVYLCANLIGPAKPAQIAGFTFGAGVLFFPLSYVFGDILTEVYGYARARRVVWAGFAAMGFAALMASVVVALPAAPGWENQAAYETIFGQTPRIVLASLLAYWAGEFTNSYVLAKMKLWTEGRWLWTRTIGSTIFGEGVDSLIFYPVAFAGIWSTELLLSVMLSNYLLKVLWEILLTPLTYKIVGFLKRAEGVDYYDRGTNFSPFSLGLAESEQRRSVNSESPRG